MSTFAEVFVLGVLMDILNVTEQRFPFLPHHTFVAVWSRCRDPVHMVGDAMYPR